MVQSYGNWSKIWLCLFRFDEFLDGLLYPSRHCIGDNTYKAKIIGHLVKGKRSKGGKPSIKMNQWPNGKALMGMAQAGPYVFRIDGLWFAVPTHVTFASYLEVDKAQGAKTSTGTAKKYSATELGLAWINLMHERWTSLIISRTCGSSGRGCLNQLGMLSRQSSEWWESDMFQVSFQKRETFWTLLTVICTFLQVVWFLGCISILRICFHWINLRILLFYGQK